MKTNFKKMLVVSETDPTSEYVREGSVDQPEPVRWLIPETGAFGVPNSVRAQCDHPLTNDIEAEEDAVVRTKGQ